MMIIIVPAVPLIVISGTVMLIASSSPASRVSLIVTVMSVVSLTGSCATTMGTRLTVATAMLYEKIHLLE